MIVIEINGVLATRPRPIYLGRRPYRAGLILSNLLSVPVKTLFRGRPVTDCHYLKKAGDVLVRLTL